MMLMMIDFFFFKQKTAYEIGQLLEFRRVLFRSGGFLLIAMIAAVAGLIARRRNIERARLELAARRSASWLDPKIVAIGIEVGRALGWRRIVKIGRASCRERGESAGGAGE